MKTITILAGLTVLAAGAYAQTATTTKDADIVGLSTPTVLGSGKSEFGLQFNSFRSPDSTARMGASIAYGFGNGWQAKLAGTFSNRETYNLSSSQQILYGGSEGDVLLKYQLPGTTESAIELGLGVSDTPAQNRSISSLLGLSAGFEATQGVRLYINPKLVSLNTNSLFGVGLGAVVNVAHNVSLFGNWTPLLSGNNTIDSNNGSSERISLYGFGVRLSNLSPGLDLDLAYTNVIGEAFGFSLTPSVGNTGGVYVGLGYRF